MAPSTRRSTPWRADPSNGNGRLTIDFGNDDRAAGVVIQPDGKIVVVGLHWRRRLEFRPRAPESERIVRHELTQVYGKFEIDFAGAADFAEAAALQLDGHIVVAGYTQGIGIGINLFAIARVTPAGILDVTFDRDGRQTTSFGNDDRIFSLAIQLDGKIVAAGSGTG